MTKETSLSQELGVSELQLGGFLDPPLISPKLSSWGSQLLQCPHCRIRCLDFSLERPLGQFSVPSPMCPSTLTTRHVIRLACDSAGISSLKPSSWKTKDTCITYHVTPSSSWEFLCAPPHFVVTETLFVHQPDVCFAIFSAKPRALYHL